MEKQLNVAKNIFVNGLPFDDDSPLLVTFFYDVGGSSLLKANFEVSIVQTGLSDSIIDDILLLTSAYRIETSKSAQFNDLYAKIAGKINCQPFHITYLTVLLLLPVDMI